jgi:hypothetical protein
MRRREFIAGLGGASSPESIVLTALVSILLVGVGVGIVGLRAQPTTSGTPTTIGSVQPQTMPDNSQKSMIDTLVLIEDRFERRLSQERQFITDGIRLVSWIGGAFLAVILAIVVYFGYQSFSSIEKRINKGVEDKLDEKSNIFRQRFEQEIKRLHDRAAVASYITQFSAPTRTVFGIERTIITQTDIERFVEILADENADSTLVAQIHDLLSDSSHDSNSSLVNKTLVEMVSCA